MNPHSLLTVLPMGNQLARPMRVTVTGADGAQVDLDVDGSESLQDVTARLVASAGGGGGGEGRPSAQLSALEADVSALRAVSAEHEGTIAALRAEVGALRAQLIEAVPQAALPPPQAPAEPTAGASSSAQP